jgi:hypothetical protein
VSVGQQPNGTTGGWNGGGNGESLGQGGGGASDARTGGTAYSNRIIVAGGGGGAGYWSNLHVVGGVGGGLVGGDGYRNTTADPGGQGGTQSGTGLGTCVTLNNSSVSGGFGFGGSPSGCGCEGYGGGGGSGYLLASATNTTFTSGLRTGHGQVTISYNTNGSGISVTPSATSICNGGNVALTASGVNSYTWNNGFSNNASISVTPAVTTNYTVEGTNSLGCISMSVITVTVAAGLPTVNIASSSATSCPGKSITLTASGAASYVWTGGITNGVPFSAPVTTTYTVTGANACGNGTAAITITVTALPVVAITSHSLICSQNVVTLTAAGAPNYTWQPGGMNTATVTVSPYSTTVYTVTASDGTCQGVASVTVNTNPNPTITVVTTSSLICAGESITLTASGADTYSWNPAVITGSTGVATPTNPVNYQVSGTNSVGCSGNGAQLVLVNPLPIVNAVANPTLVCPGNSSSLTTSGNAISYTWSTGSSSSPNVVNPAITTTYTITGESAYCTNSNTVTVNVFPGLLPVSANTVVCRGSATTLTAGAGTGYSWSNGSVFASTIVTPSVSTIYSVSAMTTSNNVSCPGSNTVEVLVNPKPEVIAASTRTAICRAETTTLTATGAATYSWNSVAGTPTYTFSSNVMNTYNFILIGVDANGCRDTASIQVKVSGCVGINENPASALKVYPNPNAGTFTIRGEPGMTVALTLMNEIGQVIRVFRLNPSNNFEVNVKELSNGIYFIKGETDQGVINQKILVEK